MHISHERFQPKKDLKPTLKYKGLEGTVSLFVLDFESNYFRNGTPN